MTRTEWWLLSDDELLRQCEEDHYRSSGPGGQKKNKTESSVRLRHQPTGVIVTGSEARSLQENRRRAIRRLREAVALRHRQSFDAALIAQTTERDDWQLLTHLSQRDPRYLSLASLLLDFFDQHQGRAADAAAALGVSTAKLIRFLQSSDECWQAAQEIRQAHGLKPLNSNS